MYISATSSGEVKVWSAKECLPLGIINSPNWNITNMRSYITKIKANHTSEGLTAHEESSKELTKKDPSKEKKIE
jgi:hypothetical protein